jgi:predicted amidophosphoribosyltransferase
MNHAPAFSRYLRATLDLLLPRACVACDGPMDSHESGLVCTLCWSRVALIPSPRCGRCGHPTGGHD